MISISIAQLQVIVLILNSTLIALMFVYLKFGIEKRIKIFEYQISDRGELNKKIHDSLIGYEDSITNGKPMSERLQKRIRMCASRVEKYDTKLRSDLLRLLEIYPLEENGAVNLETFDTLNQESKKLVREIRTRVDKIMS